MTHLKVQELVAWLNSQKLLVEQIKGGVARELYPQSSANIVIGLMEQHNVHVLEQLGGSK